jgi:hypothetical protein
VAPEPWSVTLCDGLPQLVIAGAATNSAAARRSVFRRVGFMGASRLRFSIRPASGRSTFSAELS